LLLALSACATLPPARPQAAYWGLLPAESELYLYADLRSTRALVQSLAARLSLGDPRRLEPVLRRSEALYAGLRFTAGRPPAGGAALVGRFCPEEVGFRLDCSCDWRRGQGQPPSWRHRRLLLEVAAPESGLLLLATGPGVETRELLDRWRAPRPNPLAEPEDPGGADLLRGLKAGSLLYAYLPRLPASASFPSGVPLSGLWITVRREAERYELAALASIELAEPPSPRWVLSAVRLAAAAWLRRAGVADPAGRLGPLRVESSGRVYAVTGLILQEEELLQVLGFPPRAARREAGGSGGGLGREAQSPSWNSGG